MSASKTNLMKTVLIIIGIILLTGLLSSVLFASIFTLLKYALIAAGIYFVVQVYKKSRKGSS